MSISLHEASTAAYVRGFRALADLLAKAKDHGGDALVEKRLAPDMLNLAGQVQRASDTAKFGVARVADVEAPSFEDNETTIDQLLARIDGTVKWIESVPAEKVDAGASRTITRKFGPHERTFTANEYLMVFALPNFYFHITTAYDILRHNGVGVGKLDYLGFNG
ncbi:MAG TPA: DUF1993 domain-containing protein [Luteibacter sp.]|jgi:hypothetical protein|uniref:DUF1993 domain-containing protein n=1 Tax=Luteibacter sp. TaxID=1886636 RepID=UPI002F42B8DB